MAFDGIVLKKIVDELNTCIINSKVDKIFQPDNNTILLGLYVAPNNYALNISIHPENYRIHLTTHSKPNPKSAPSFCMSLRKNLLGNKISNISISGLERIVKIDFESHNDLNEFSTRTMFIELMGKFSNIILVNSENIIINLLKASNSSIRNLKIGEKYSLPPNSKIDFLSLTDYTKFQEIVGSDKKNLTLFAGFSQIFIQYIFEKLNIADETISSSNLIKIYDYIKSIIESENTEIINYKDNYCVDISNSSLPFLKNNFFIDDFYYNKENEELYKNSKNNLLRLVLKALEKCTNKLNSINSKINECKDINKYKIYGELITANLYKLKEKVSYIKLENYYDNNNLIEIPLDISISPNKNAEKYFKKYNKLKNTLNIVSKQKEETEVELEYLDSLVYSIKEAYTIDDINEIISEISDNELFKDFFKKSLKSSKNKIHTSLDPQKCIINGFTVLYGKNNKQNDYITFKLAKPNDIWFHVQKMHGTHVLLKPDGKNISNDVILECAKLCKQNSKAKYSLNVAVDYTLAKNVKRHPSKKTGMVLYTNYKTIIV